MEITDQLPFYNSIVNKEYYEIKQDQQTIGFIVHEVSGMLPEGVIRDVSYLETAGNWMSWLVNGESGSQSSSAPKPTLEDYQVAIRKRWNEEWKAECDKEAKELDRLQKQLKGFKEIKTADQEEKYLKLKEVFEVKLMEFSAYQRKMVEELITLIKLDKHPDQIELLIAEKGRIKEHFEGYKDQLKETQERLEPYLEMRRNKVETVDFQTDVYAATTPTIKGRTLVLDTWHLEPWGQILIDSQSVYEGAKTKLGFGFQEDVNAIKHAMAVHPKDSKEYGEYDRRLKQLFLQRAIDVLGKINSELKRGKVEENKRAVMQEHRATLDAFYQQQYNDYLIMEATMAQEVPFLEKFWEQTKETLTLGYLSETYIPSEEVQRRKHYADLGYVMMEDVQKLLSDLKVKPGESWVDAIKNEVQSFWRWAESHPLTAEELAGDLQLTIAMLNDQTFTTRFANTLYTRAMTRAFIGEMHAVSQDPIDTEQQLKYRALADLVRYLPTATGAGSAVYRTVSDGTFNPTTILINAAKGAISAKATQTASKIVPSEWTDIAAVAAQVVKGDSFHKIMRRRNDLEMVRIGGLAKDILINPKSTWNFIKQEARIWAESLFKARGNELFARLGVQVALPVVMAGAATAILAVGTFTTLITLGAAAPIVVLILGSGAAAYRRLYNLVNLYWPQTRSDIMAEIRQERIEQGVDSISHDATIRQKIEGERNAFVASLKKFKRIPDLKPLPLVLDTATQQMAEKHRDKIYYDVVAAIKTTPIIKKDLMKPILDRFNKFADIEEVRKRVKVALSSETLTETQRPAFEEMLVREVVNKLIDERLNSDLFDCFAHRISALYGDYAGEVDAFKRDLSSDERGQLDPSLVELFKQEIKVQKPDSSVLDKVDRLVA